MQTSNKENTLFIRINPNTKKTLKNLAEDKGLNVSTYCRTILLEKIKGIKKENNDDTDAS